MAGSAAGKVQAPGERLELRDDSSGALVEAGAGEAASAEGAALVFFAALVFSAVVMAGKVLGARNPMCNLESRSWTAL